MGLRTWLGLKTRKKKKKKETSDRQPAKTSQSPTPQANSIAKPLPNGKDSERAGLDALPTQSMTQAIATVQSGNHDKENMLHFQAFAEAIAGKCKGQLYQDAWALWQTEAKRGGYFVEFGAANGVHFSNSYLLEKEFGWTGILAEPHPDFMEHIRAHRSCHITNKCVFSRSGDTLSFMAAKNGEFSRITSIDPKDHQDQWRAEFCEVAVETISLNDLLIEADAPREIDYMSIDTEGSEFEILSHFDFDRWDVRIMTLEHNYTPMRAAICDLLAKHGYRRVWPEITNFDDWYVRL